MGEKNREFLLSPYRVLDLTDERGLLCGKILADLGPTLSRWSPQGEAPPGTLALFTMMMSIRKRASSGVAYAVNKRGITLNLHTSDGRELLRRLVKEAHFLVESFPPGYLDGLGLGYMDLANINQSLVMVSITPFGQDGPYAHHKAPDIVGMAMGGFMYLTGDGDRPPIRVGFPHFYLHGAAAGATGAMIAHTHRSLTGEGQHVDVSCQQAVAKTLAHAPQSWDMEGVLVKRMGAYRQTSGETLVRVNWRCKDGHVNYMLQGGGPGVARSTRALLNWMDEEGHGQRGFERSELGRTGLWTG